jgi:hypothetical protein
MPRRPQKTAQVVQEQMRKAATAGESSKALVKLAQYHDSQALINAVDGTIEEAKEQQDPRVRKGLDLHERLFTSILEQTEEICAILVKEKDIGGLSKYLTAVSGVAVQHRKTLEWLQNIRTLELLDNGVVADDQTLLQEICAIEKARLTSS